MTLPAPLLFFIFAIASGTTARSCKSTPKAAAQTAPKVVQKGSQVSAVKMSRGYCYGRCPVYSIEVQSNGLVRYSGKQFVEKEGIYEKTFTPAAVGNLIQEFNNARVDTMKTTYERLLSDMPSINYTFTFSDGQTKEVENAHYGPQVLAKLAQRMDELVQTPDYSWKRIAAKVEE